MKAASILGMISMNVLVMAAGLPTPSFSESLPVPRFDDPLPVPRFDNPVPEVSAPVPMPTEEPTPPPKDRDDGLILVMVTSKTCGPCQGMKHVLDRVGGKWSVRYVDFDEPGWKQWMEVYGIKGVPYYVAYRGHEALEVADGVMSLEEVLGWLGRLEQGLPPDPDGRFRRCTAQDSLKPVDREYLQMRLTPGSCGMLGCMAHGGGWVTESVKEVPDEKKPKGHWETRPGACPTCPPQRVWVADPDPTGTVPWNSGGFFGRRGGW